MFVILLIASIALSEAHYYPPAIPVTHEAPAPIPHKIYGAPSKPVEIYAAPIKPVEIYVPKTPEILHTEKPAIPIKPIVTSYFYEIPHEPITSKSVENYPTPSLPSYDYGPPINKPVHVAALPPKPVEIYAPPINLIETSYSYVIPHEPVTNKPVGFYPPPILTCNNCGQPINKPVKVYAPPQKPAEIYGPPEKPVAPIKPIVTSYSYVIPHEPVTSKPVGFYPPPSLPCNNCGQPINKLAEVYAPPQKPAKIYGPPEKPAVPIKPIVTSYSYKIPHEPVTSKPVGFYPPPSLPCNNCGQSINKPAEVYAPPQKLAKIYGPPEKPVAPIKPIVTSYSYEIPQEPVTSKPVGFYPPPSLPCNNCGQSINKPAEVYAPPQKPAKIYGPPEKSAAPIKPIVTSYSYKIPHEPVTSKPVRFYPPSKPEKTYEIPRTPAPEIPLAPIKPIVTSYSFVIPPQPITSKPVEIYSTKKLQIEHETPGQSEGVYQSTILSKPIETSYSYSIPAETPKSVYNAPSKEFEIPGRYENGKPIVPHLNYGVPNNY